MVGLNSESIRIFFVRKDGLKDEFEQDLYKGRVE